MAHYKLSYSNNDVSLHVKELQANGSYKVIERLPVPYDQIEVCIAECHAQGLLHNKMALNAALSQALNL
jgi:long-subunit fatty acid transport protein